MKYLDISDYVYDLGEKADNLIQDSLRDVSRVVRINSEKVLGAFHKNRVSDADFNGTTGYGYNDLGRDKLDRIYADIFKADDALVRLQFVNGTHAISCAMFACLNAGDTMISITGAPYDTLVNTINGEYFGNLASYGVKYKQVDLLDGRVDMENALSVISKNNIKLVFIQKSRGYADRQPLSNNDILNICKNIKDIDKNINILVDNCYGEFCETIEPIEAGADIIAGSLIKNPGGGIAPAGGYIAGRGDLIKNASMRMTAPGIGRECGSTLYNNRLLYQGIFMAPHTTGEAIKTAIFCSKIMELLNYNVSPTFSEKRFDIIQTVNFGCKNTLLSFCNGIQKGAPIDSFVVPEPWAMPGYNDDVIMAAGAFIQGASIELSADAPMREPYICYIQGGLTFESARAGILIAVNKMLIDCGGLNGINKL